MADLNISKVLATVGDRHAERPAMMRGSRVMTYAELLDRSKRLAHFLEDQGLRCFTERSELAGHQVGQHLMAQYLYNGTEYVEGMFGAFFARVAPFNVNYHYRAEELTHLLQDAKPTAIQYHGSFAPLLAEVLPSVPSLRVLLQVDDGSGHPLLPGAVDYELALQGVSPQVSADPSPDDLYVLYTGGTTGMPKGVLWRQADMAVATLSLLDRRERTPREWTSAEEIADALPGRFRRLLPCAPLMHGAAQWGVLSTLCEGEAVVFPEHADSFAPDEVLKAVELHRVTTMNMVGDAFAYPLVDAMEERRHDVSSLRTLISGGAALHPAYRQRLLALVPNLRVVETIGSSESGLQGRRESTGTGDSAGAVFGRSDTTLVIADDYGRALPRGHDGTGWLASTGRIPLGYLGDEAKTARTFPVVDGVRVSLPGDRARLLPNGDIELLGRDSMVINTGGEKVFVEEVEAAIKDHPDVVDALVVGRPSERWGTEVVAVLQVSSPLDEVSVKEFCRGRLARYKVPKQVYFAVDVKRLPAGKGDYKWASKLVAAQFNTNKE
jgi:acyl-CoA synthetase (AMP-forming)/AMP-acid ligase II